MASQYNDLSIKNGRLIIEVIDHSNNEVVDIASIALWGSEYDLQGGRFKHFDRSIFLNSVEVIQHRPIEKSFYQGLNNALEWVAENVYHPWSFGIMKNKISGRSLEFYFNDSTDALLFRLSLN